MWGRNGWACLALAGFGIGGVVQGAEKKDRVPRLLAPFDAAAVQQTVEGAREKLAAPSCQSLLDEFKTSDGKSLRSRLDESRTTLDDRLREVRFFDASEFAACRSGKNYAFTRPGLGAVYVCTARFTPARLREPDQVEAVVIHELLHTIGLPENPPTPEYITARVKDRCHARAEATSR